MSTQTKNTLFRFVTMRAPELIEKEEIKNSFVQHPDVNRKETSATESYFLKSINIIPSSKLKKDYLKETALLFSGDILSTRENLIKFIGKENFDFAIWLTSNRKKIIREVVEVKINEQNLIGLNHNQRIALWDNLFYQIITYKSGSVRDAIFSILVADFFLNKFKYTDEESIRKLAQARVILPKEMFSKDDNKVVLKTRNKPNTKNLDTSMQKVLIEEQLNQVKALLEETSLLEKKYSKDNQRLLAEYNQSYDSEIKEAYEKASKTKTVIDPITSEKSEVTFYENLLVPDYKFKAGDELEFLIQNTQIPSNKWLVENCKSKLNFTSFEDVTNYLLEKEEKLIQMQFALSPMGKKFINHNGTILPISDINESNRLNQFSFNSLGLMHTKKIVMLFDGIDAGTDIVSASYSVTFENGSMHQNSIFTYAFVNNKLSVTIFNREGHYFTNILDGDVQFQGTLITSSNEQIIFNGYGTIRDEQSGGGSSSQNLDWGSEFYGNGGDSNVNFNLTGNGSYTIPDATTVTNPQTGEIIVVPIAGSESSLDNHELENPIDGAILSAIEYIPSGFGVKRLGIADYRRVEQEICCYVPGEVSHIENVMASEYKERSTRRLRRTEDTTTTLKEKESEKLTDSTSTERFEMNQEVATVLTEDTHLGGFVSADTKFGKASELHAGADFANNTSSDESNTQAVMHAKDITERVLDRVVQKIKEERISKVIEEFEENNKHGYDNRENSEHVSGVYRWVDKIYKNKIINYGKRLMYEFMIPEPAVFHKKAIEGRKIDEGEIIVKPVDPRIGSDNLKLSIDTINKSYKYWAEIYNVDVEVCPEETIRVGESFRVAYDSTGVKIGATEAQSGFGKIKIPANYVANYAIGNYNAISENAYGRISLTIGDITKSTVAGTNFKTLNINEPLKGNYSLEVPVSFTLISMLIGDITANVICKLTDSAKQQWQVETFNAIIKAYENKLEEYNAKIKEAKAIQTEKLKTNPLFYRQIENTVLRKNCIEYLASHEQVGKSFIKNGALKDMQVHFDSPNLETYVAKIKFLEQAFEWNLMSYNLYPFYWANKDNWETLYNIEETDDATFRAFLQSGMARVILTIRPGFEEVVNWYMATGQVWNGGQVPTMDDELFISIVEELTETEGEIEETWESRVPTSLTIIQAGSIGLEVESALPCDDECKDYKLFDTDGNPVFDKENKQVSTNPFKKKTTNLKGKSAEPLNVKIDDRKIENIDLKNGNLQLTTNSKPRKVIAQISVEAIKREMGLNQGK